MSKLIKTHSFTLRKTGSYYLTHVTVAALVAYAVTGDVVAAMTLSFLEPTVQAVVYFFHERAWQKVDKKSGAVIPSHQNQPMMNRYICYA
jgi:uncharacterized membrane protein